MALMPSESNQVASGATGGKVKLLLALMFAVFFLLGGVTNINDVLISICGRPLWQGLFVELGLIGCFHMSGLFVRLLVAAGLDGNPPVRSLIKLARI